MTKDVSDNNLCYLGWCKTCMHGLWTGFRLVWSLLWCPMCFVLWHFIYVRLESIKLIYAWNFKSILLIIYPYIIMETLFEDYAIEPLNKGQKTRSQSVLCSAVWLYTMSLARLRPSFFLKNKWLYQSFILKRFALLCSHAKGYIATECYKAGMQMIIFHP